SIFAGALHAAAVVWLSFAGAVHIGFAASVGVCLSVICSRTTRATYATLVVLAASWVLPLVAANYWVGLTGSVAARHRWLTAFLEEGLVPPMTWWHLAISSGDLRYQTPSDARLAGVLLGLVV